MTTVARDFKESMTNLIARRPFESPDANPVFDILQPTNSVLQGAIQRTSTTYGKTATVKAGEDIRPALEALKSAGGGTLVLLAGIHKPTYDIVGGSKINIVGEGKDQTIIDFQNAAYSLQYVGTSSIYVSGFRIENLTVQNSSQVGIDIQYADSFSFNKILSYSHGGIGISIQYANDFECVATTADSNTGANWYLASAESNLNLQNFSLINCQATNGSSYGFHFDNQSGAVTLLAYFSLINCQSINNGNDGLFFDGTSSTGYGFARVIGFHSNQNSGASYDIDVGAYVLFSGCYAGEDFEIAVGGNVIIGLTIPSANISDASTSGNTYVGISGYSITNDSVFSQFQESTQASSSFDLTFLENRELRRAENVSGGTLAAGSVVVYAGTTAGDEITTTTTAGDDKVCGVTAVSHNNAQYQKIIVEGKTTILKVNGTTDIAVGDFLCTYSTAGIAQKAAAGDMAFAIALEAYATNDSNGVIDALIIKPRKL